MSACSRCTLSARSCWRPYILPTGGKEKKSVAEHFGVTSKFDITSLVVDGNIIIREEDVGAYRFALWKICSAPVPLSQQVPSYSSLEPRTVPSLVQYLFEEGWGERCFDEFIPEHSLQKLRFDLDIDEQLVQNAKDRHISVGFWIRVVFKWLTCCCAHILLISTLVG
jgi:hypothetical protein